MRSLFLLAGSLVFLGCAHQAEERVVFVERSEPSFEVAAPSTPAVVAQQDPTNRPRLGHVVTLGQNSPDAAYDSPDAPPPPPAAPQGPNVVINNYGSGGYGYGYGGYYGGYGYGYPGSYGTGTRGARSQQRSTQAWAPNGNEGAARTAAPGQTPGVAGNWPTPPSYGPRPR